GCCLRRERWMDWWRRWKESSHPCRRRLKHVRTLEGCGDSHEPDETLEYVAEGDRSPAAGAGAPQSGSLALSCRPPAARRPRNRWVGREIRFRPKLPRACSISFLCLDPGS